MRSSRPTRPLFQPARCLFPHCSTPHRLFSSTFRWGIGLRSRSGGAMERLGWDTHLHGIRSFEKLTAGGMTFDDTDVIRILEDVLPGRFGGGPTDYQLIEDTHEDGHPRLRLLVHPKVGPLDPTAVCNAFLRAVGGDDEIRRDMAAQWRDGDFLCLDRTAPHGTETGKILHLIAAPAS